MRSRPRLLLSVVLCTFACGGGSSGPSLVEQQAEADKKKKAQEEADAAVMAERKAKREAEEKVKAEAEAKIAAELERLCVVPDKLPKDPVAACDAVGTAYDAYVRRVGDAAAIADWDGGGKEKAVPMAVVQCTQADSLKTAACQKHALDNAGPELKDEVKKMMQICIDKFAAKKAPAGAAVPQRRPG